MSDSSEKKPAIITIAVTIAIVLALVIGLRSYWQPGKPRSPLGEAVFQKNAAMVQKLLDSGADANDALPDAFCFQPGGGMTAEHRHNLFGVVLQEPGSPVLVNAGMSGSSEIIDALLKHGAKINAPDQYGQTALIAASWKGDAATAQALLNQKADVTIKDAAGKSALDWATGEKHADVVALLQQAGAK